MLMDWQNPSCRNGYTTKSNLYVQCNENSNDILHRDGKSSSGIHMEARITRNSQSNPKQKEEHWSYHIT
jgi:hypothetical protein